MQTLRRVLSEKLPSGGRVAIDIAGSGALVLHITASEDFEPAVSYAVVKTQWPATTTDLDSPSPGEFEIATDSLKVFLNLSPFSIRVEDRAGLTRFESKGEFKADAGGISIARSLAAKEGVYGLGEHGEIFNRSPGVYRIWNKDEPTNHAFRQYYCTIPFGISVPGGASAPHGFFVDNPGELIFDVGRTIPDELRIDVKTGDLTLWLFFEDTPAEILEEYTALTGRMLRPPMWALGYQQCRWSYKTAERVREVAGEFRRRRIPCDVIYMDIDYMDAFRVFTWNPEAFADEETLLRDLRDEGFSPLCIIDPGVAIQPGYFAYEEGLKTPGFFLSDKSGELIVERVWPGDVHMPDFTNPQTRKIWGQWQAESLLAIGIAGVWNDMNEPAVFATTTPTREFPADAVHHDFGLHRTHDRVHNIYGLTMAQASWEGQVAYDPQRRPFTLTRSGWAGVQRYSAVWTGDNASAFTTMPMDIALNLNMGMSGVSFVGCDIGGFSFNATPELFARWMEWGAFQPFCRGHSCAGTIDQEPWALGGLTERIARRMIELRYQLLPYIYTQFVESAETGMPVNRPLILQYPFDATVTSIGDEFLLGADILVAPILHAGVTHRAVYLPAGEWMHFWSNARHQGGRWILAEAPLGQPPVYIRAGAIIPMHPVRQHTKEAEPETTYLDIFPGARLEGKLVEDDGATMGYRDGAESTILFSGDETEMGLNLIIGAPQGPYRSARKQWTIRLHRPNRPLRAVTCNGANAEFELTGGVYSWTIKDERRALHVKVEYGA
ncbi:glycoside hydrolase family 31 protein [soil metagenome]